MFWLPVFPGATQGTTSDSKWKSAMASKRGFSRTTWFGTKRNTDLCTETRLEHLSDARWLTWDMKGCWLSLKAGSFVILESSVTYVLNKQIKQKNLMSQFFYWIVLLLIKLFAMLTANVVLNFEAVSLIFIHSFKKLNHVY